jgi:3-oxoacyl-(acyl-carrier-protein) synthase
MRRVVVTGLGIVSSIGNNAGEVLSSLKAGRSGIAACAEMAEHGFRSQIAGTLDIDVAEHVDKRTLRFMPSPMRGWRRTTSSTRAPGWWPGRAGRPPRPCCRRTRRC